MTIPSARAPLGTPRARRLEWPFLPPDLRDAIATRCGGEVVDATSCPAGFTPGLASVLTLADGSRHFVKAASLMAQRGSALSYRAEVAVLADLPCDLPTPDLQWSMDDGWVVLGFPYAGEPVVRPWTASSLGPCLDALEQVASAGLGTLAPASAAEEFAAWPGYYDHLLTRPHLDEARALANGFATAVTGDTLVHTEPRADNFVLWAGAAARLVDWTWPVVGAPWLDTVLLLIEAYDDGLDVERELARRSVTRDVPAEQIDTFLALMAGYWLKSGDDAVPPAAPHLRQHQRAAGEAAWRWLHARRGWE